MDAEARQKLEEEIRGHHARGELREATAVAIQGYGPEILRFLATLLRDPDDAGEVFSRFCEEVWTSIPSFRWQSSFRTWAYVIARRAYLTHRQNPHVRRNVPLSEHPQLSQVEQEVRTRTIEYIRTDVKHRARQLREALDPEDQTLLVLRVDRDIPWSDIAVIMLGPDAAEDPAEVKRKAAALRKRFERVKEELRELAVKAKLLEES